MGTVQVWTRDADGRRVAVMVDAAIAEVMREPHMDEQVGTHGRVLSYDAYRGTYGGTLDVEYVPSDADAPIEALVCEQPLGLAQYRKPRTFGHFWMGKATGDRRSARAFKAHMTPEERDGYAAMVGTVPMLARALAVTPAIERTHLAWAQNAAGRAHARAMYQLRRKAAVEARRDTRTAEEKRAARADAARRGAWNRALRQRADAEQHRVLMAQELARLSGQDVRYV